MNWFEEQITQRVRRDNNEVVKANLALSSVVMGERVFANYTPEEEEYEGLAMNEILNFYGVSHSNELMQREVLLEEAWWKDAMGAMLAKKQSGEIVALIPNRMGGYSYYNAALAKRMAVTKATLLEEKAYLFYRSLPKKKLSVYDLVHFVASHLSRWDFLSYLLISLSVILIAAISPYITRSLFGNVIPTGNYTMLLGLGVLIVCITLSKSLFEVAKSLVMSRIQSKISFSLSPAVYWRMLMLPASFFRTYTAGELTERMGAVYQLTDLIFNSIVTSVITTLFSFIYLIQIGEMNAVLFDSACWILGVMGFVSLLTTLVEVRVMGEQMKVSAKLNGLIFRLIAGIQKIKLVGAEKRAYAQWGNLYKQKAQCEYNPPLLMKIGATLTETISVASVIVFYYVAAKNGVSVADYMTFTVSFGLISGALLSFTTRGSSIASIKPTLDMARPLMEAIPEIFEGKQHLVHLNGSIELSHIRFRYEADSPWILDDFSLKINAGEYVAIVGKSGCGKSTLIRLLLGFEVAHKGVIYYDGKSFDKLDARDLRKKIGVVMQGSKLFAGSIFANISISNPMLTMEQAWEVAEIAGIKEYIEGLPMGMHTLIPEGGGGFSGGQKQRIIIARAIASNPSILIFDEATSALDNVTQKQVTEALDKLECTKIVIAHRLSTIKNCNRIIVMENGQIKEEGGYDELMQKKEHFYQLVKRQV
ncbi:MAG: ATP-binding cassette domain-containing protein [Phocaeicola sp.]